MLKDQTQGGSLSFFRIPKTTTKLFVGFLVASLLMVCMGAVGISKLGSAQTSLKLMYVNNFKAASWLGTVQVGSESVPRQMLELAMTKYPAVRATIKAKIVALDAVIDTNWASYSTTNISGQEKLRADFNSAMPEYRRIRNERLIPLIEAGDTTEFFEKRKELVLPLLKRIAADTASMMVIEGQAAVKTVANSEAAYQSSRMLIAFILIPLFALIGLVVGIGRPLQKTLYQLKSMAAVGLFSASKIAAGSAG